MKTDADFRASRMLDASLFAMGPSDIYISSFSFSDVILKPVQFWTSRYRWGTASLAKSGIIGFLDNNPVFVSSRLEKHHCRLLVTGSRWDLCFNKLDEFEGKCGHPLCKIEEAHAL